LSGRASVSATSATPSRKAVSPSPGQSLVFLGHAPQLQDVLPPFLAVDEAGNILLVARTFDDTVEQCHQVQLPALLDEPVQHHREAHQRLHRPPAERQFGAALGGIGQHPEGLVFADALLPRPAGQLVQGALADAALGDVDDAPQADAIAGVLDKGRYAMIFLTSRRSEDTGADTSL
jgi:hypothetical protein